jgi:hypothetical protein
MILNKKMWGAFLLVVIPMLACGPARPQVTPTPTKTPRIIRTLEPLSTPTVAEVMVPTNTFTPEIPPTETPVPVPTATDTPTPEPAPPTDTPPPPTNTPPPPPPTNTPAPPPPTQPPANAGPQIVIELPSGDKFGMGDEIKVNIRVSDSDGVRSFKWGVFTQNGVAVKGGDRNCGNGSSCGTEEEFEAVLDGTFQIGVEAEDAQGNKSIEKKQIYVG